MCWGMKSTFIVCATGKRFTERNVIGCVVAVGVGMAVSAAVNRASMR